MKYPIIKATDLGLTNFNYLSDNQTLVRYSHKYCDAFLDRQNETKVIAIIQKHFLETLPILDYGWDDTNHFFAVTKYEPELLTFERIGISRAYLSRIFDLITKLHKIPPSVLQGIKTFNYREVITWFYQYANADLKAIIPWNCIETNLKQLEALKSNFQYCLCHNDLVPGNFAILYNRLYLIDFEYAQINDRIFDFASFVSESLTKPDHVEEFLELCSFTQEEKIRFYLWVDYQNLLWSLWANYLYQKTGKLIYAEIQDQKLQRILNKK